MFEHLHCYIFGRSATLRATVPEKLIAPDNEERNKNWQKKHHSSNELYLLKYNNLLLNCESSIYKS